MDKEFERHIEHHRRAMLADHPNHVNPLSVLICMLAEVLEPSKPDQPEPEKESRPWP